MKQDIEIPPELSKTFESFKPVVAGIVDKIINRPSEDPTRDTFIHQGQKTLLKCLEKYGNMDHYQFCFWSAELIQSEVIESIRACAHLAPEAWRIYEANKKTLNSKKDKRATLLGRLFIKKIKPEDSVIQAITFPIARLDIPDERSEFELHTGKTIFNIRIYEILDTIIRRILKRNLKLEHRLIAVKNLQSLYNKIPNVPESIILTFMIIGSDIHSAFGHTYIIIKGGLAEEIDNLSDGFTEFVFENISNVLEQIESAGKGYSHKENKLSCLPTLDSYPEQAMSWYTSPKQVASIRGHSRDSH